MKKFKIGDVIRIDCIEVPMAHGKIGKIKDILPEVDGPGYLGSNHPYLIEPIGWSTGESDNRCWATEGVLRISNSSVIKEKLGVK